MVELSWQKVQLPKSWTSYLSVSKSHKICNTHMWAKMRTLFVLKKCKKSSEVNCYIITLKKKEDKLKNSHESSNLAACSIKTMKYDFSFFTWFYLSNLYSFSISISWSVQVLKKEKHRTTQITTKIQGLGLQVHQYFKT